MSSSQYLITILLPPFNISHVPQFLCQQPYNHLHYYLVSLLHIPWEIVWPGNKFANQPACSTCLFFLFIKAHSTFFWLPFPSSTMHLYQITLAGCPNKHKNAAFLLQRFCKTICMPRPKRKPEEKQLERMHTCDILKQLATKHVSIVL